MGSSSRQHNPQKGNTGFSALEETVAVGGTALEEEREMSVLTELGSSSLLPLEFCHFESLGCF